MIKGTITRNFEIRGALRNFCGGSGRKALRLAPKLSRIIKHGSLGGIGQAVFSKASVKFWGRIHGPEERYVFTTDEDNLLIINALKTLIFNLNITLDPAIVEIGSGKGRLAHMVREKMGVVVHQTDIIDRSGFGDWGGLYTKASADDLPFASSSFDIGISAYAIEYVGEMALKELARIVKPGGGIVLFVHCRESELVAKSLEHINDFWLRLFISGLKIAGIFTRENSDFLDLELKLCKRMVEAAFDSREALAKMLTKYGFEIYGEVKGVPSASSTGKITGYIVAARKKLD